MIVRMKPYYCSRCERFLRKRDVRHRGKWNTRLISKCKKCGAFALHTTTYLEGVIFSEGRHREELLAKLRGEKQ